MARNITNPRSRPVAPSKVTKVDSRQQRRLSQIGRDDDSIHVELTGEKTPGIFPAAIVRLEALLNNLLESQHRLASLSGGGNNISNDGGVPINKLPPVGEIFSLLDKLDSTAQMIAQESVALV